MDYWMMTVSGNVFCVKMETNGRVMLDRVGVFKDGESRTFKAKPFADVPRKWLDGAVANGTAVAVVPMIGGGWMRESEYVDSITA